MSVSMHPCQPQRLAGYVMAGGGSTRFGQDKALAELGGPPMLARVIELVKCITSRVDIIGAPDKYSKFGIPVVPDRWPGEGPLGGIITALMNTHQCEPECEWNLIVSCDMPFLTAEWLSFLVEYAESRAADVVLPRSSGGPEPLCACWRTAAVTSLHSAFARGVRKVMDGVKPLKLEVLDEAIWKRFDSAGRLFWNLNTAAEFEEARRILEATGK